MFPFYAVSLHMLLLPCFRFLRDEDDENNLSWEEKLASKYYSSLYREFAVCDLKHYKSGNVRWHTDYRE